MSLVTNACWIAKPAQYVWQAGRQAGSNSVLGVSESITHATQYCRDRHKRFLPILAVAGGSIVGLTAGIISNLVNRSWDEGGVPLPACFRFTHIPVFGPINDWRDSQNMLPLLEPTAFSIVAIWNAVKKDDAAPSLNMAGKIRSNLRQTVFPFLQALSTQFLVGTIRGQIGNAVWNAAKIDIAGHVCQQVVDLIQRLSLFQGLSKQGTSLQIRVAFVALAALSLTEIPWMFNTASNCHSVADVISGGAIALLANFAIKKCVIPLIQWGCNQWRSKKSA